MPNSTNDLIGPALQRVVMMGIDETGKFVPFPIAEGGQAMSNATNLHSALSGLSANDHPQYALIASANTFSADQTMASGKHWLLAITNTSNIGTLASSLATLFANNVNSSTGTNLTLAAPAGKQTLILGSDGTTDATAGYVGEYLASSNTAGTNCPNSDQYGDANTDAVTLSLTAGDWDVSLVVSFVLNAATVTAVGAGIGTVTGNSATGLTEGDNFLQTSVPISTTDTTITVASWRAKITSTTSYYLKVRATYSAGNPKWKARLSARRER